MGMDLFKGKSSAPPSGSGFTAGMPDIPYEAFIIAVPIVFYFLSKFLKARFGK